MNTIPFCRPSAARIARRVTWATAMLLLAAHASAATYTVGPGDTCTHATLQAAVDAAANNPGADTVRIVRTATWTAQQISTDTDQDVEILGGYQGCDDNARSGKTTLSGAGGNARSVLALRGNGVFRLRNLVIRGGDQAGDDDGGGIHFIGGGIVEISDSEIADNSADAGGGIYAHGTGAAARLIIGANVSVASNTARTDGGGIVALNIEMTMIEPGSILLANVAGGSGGGLFFATIDRTTRSYIGSTGFAQLGAVYGNTAAIGGGIAVTMDGDESKSAILQIFSTTPDAAVRIADNHATQRGGAIDLQPRYDPGLSGFPGFPFGTIALLRHADIVDNSAPVGAAINLAHDNWGPLGVSAIGGIVYFNEDAPAEEWHPAAAPCPVGAPCGYIRFNDTVNQTGAVVHFSEDASVYASRIVLEGNRGGWLMYLSGEEQTSLSLSNSLLTGNTVQHALLRDDQNADDTFQLVNLHHLTIVGNTIGADGVLSINEDMALTRSYIHQPGKALFATDVGSSGGIRDVQFSLASTTPTVAGAPYQPPRFVDAANGDFMPRAGAAAVDWAPAMDSQPLDLLSRPRPVDLEPNLNAYGSSDIGAFERPALQPLVLNADFDDDVHLWTQIGEFDWDGTQDAHGASDSGSVRVPLPTETEGKRAKRVGGLSQCIHVPGPGTYRLNGFGRVVPASNPPLTAHRAALVWELRGDGGTEGCDGGIPSVSGLHPLATSSEWTQPAMPALIVVPSSLWTPNTSITIRLDVSGSAAVTPTAWFDAITLEVGGIGPAPEMFGDGFE